MALTDFQNFYESTLSAPITATDLVIPLAAAPTPTEGWLLVDYDIPAKREFIYYTSRSSTTVTLPSLGVGRGRDSTTAIAHSQNAKVRMNVNAGLLQDISGLSATIVNSNNNGGWVAMSAAPSTVVYNGQRSYTATWNGTDQTGTLNPGTRLRTTRTVAAPTQCTSLNGTTQYWVKTSPNKLAFTDDFVVDAYVKLSSYAAATIVSRYNGTSGWRLVMLADGTIRIQGFNAGAANFSYVQSYQSLPLNKWVRITGQLDMSAFTATTTTSYLMIDGVDIPAYVTRGGTNPTALVQAGNLEIGAENAGIIPFPGKIAQVAIYSAKVTQANILLTHSQGLLGTETNLASAYSFNGVTTDLNTTTPNDLSAGAGSPTATNADSPFGTQASGLISSTLDYGIVQSATFSTNTTVVVQVPEGCTIPTSGGVSAVSYSGQAAPYGFPKNAGKWVLQTLNKSSIGLGAAVSGTWYNTSGFISLIVPIGSWEYGWDAHYGGYKAASTDIQVFATLSTTSSSESEPELTSKIQQEGASATISIRLNQSRSKFASFSAATPQYLNIKSGVASATDIRFDSSNVPAIVFAKNTLL